MMCFNFSFTLIPQSKIWCNHHNYFSLVHTSPSVGLHSQALIMTETFSFNSSQFL